MKISIVAIVLLLPAFAFAQQPHMSEKDMQLMMQQMQKMQTCMQGVDQNELNKLEQRSRAMDSEIKSLCAEGKRSQAEKTAMAYGMEMSKNDTVKTMRQCGEMMQGVMPQMPFVTQDKTTSNRHICD